MTPDEEDDAMTPDEEDDALLLELFLFVGFFGGVILTTALFLLIRYVL